MVSLPTRHGAIASGRSLIQGALADEHVRGGRIHSKLAEGCHVLVAVTAAKNISRVSPATPWNLSRRVRCRQQRRHDETVRYAMRSEAPMSSGGTVNSCNVTSSVTNKNKLRHAQRTTRRAAVCEHSE